MLSLQSVLVPPDAPELNARHVHIAHTVRCVVARGRKKIAPLQIFARWKIFFQHKNSPLQKNLGAKLEFRGPMIIYSVGN